MRWDGGNCLLYAAHSFMTSLIFLPASLSIMMDMAGDNKKLPFQHYGNTSPTSAPPGFTTYG